MARKEPKGTPKKTRTRSTAARHRAERQALSVAAEAIALRAVTNAEESIQIFKAKSPESGEAGE